MYAKVIDDDIDSSEPSSILPTNHDNDDDEEEEEEEDMENTWDTFFEESNKGSSKSGQKFLRDSDLDQNRDLDLILTERAERYTSSSFSSNYQHNHICNHLLCKYTHLSSNSIMKQPTLLLIYPFLS